MELFLRTMNANLSMNQDIFVQLEDDTWLYAMNKPSINIFVSECCFYCYVSVFFQLGKKCPFIQQIFRRNLSGKASTCHIKPKFHHINERLNIPCFFSDSKSSF